MQQMQNFSISHAYNFNFIESLLWTDFDIHIFYITILYNLIGYL